MTSFLLSAESAWACDPNNYNILAQVVSKTERISGTTSNTKMLGQGVWLIPAKNGVPLLAEIAGLLKTAGVPFQATLVEVIEDFQEDDKFRE